MTWLLTSAPCQSPERRESIVFTDDSGSSLVMVGRAHTHLWRGAGGGRAGLYLFWSPLLCSATFVWGVNTVFFCAAVLGLTACLLKNETHQLWSHWLVEGQSGHESDQRKCSQGKKRWPIEGARAPPFWVESINSRAELRSPAVGIRAARFWQKKKA